ncbi:hypothetical protein EDM57_19180 [Brevibacillus gelatini]|uniref:Uncharacterized protein n=1 Tax=Brevibacillus gelatini TaxID=1655277 RepID=A0A3M8AR86_9BACL|nr:hypothetical protein [Brevibacillus gelatini]RNB53708.1 hypothetical protein EDM57_19180 [Brevibacillus gelatini]
MFLLFRFILEIIRILIWMAIFLAVTSPVVTLFFRQSSPGENIILAQAALFLLYFIFYRNRLQQSGWFPSKHNQPLSRRATALLYLSAATCFSAAIFMSYLH